MTQIAPIDVTVAISAARAELGHLVARAVRGERVVITKNSFPLAELIPWMPGLPAPPAELIRIGAIEMAKRGMDEAQGQ